jgi:signal transduction histidine kinase
MTVLCIVAILFWTCTVTFWIAYATRQESGHWDAMFQTVAGQILYSMPGDLEVLAAEPKAAPSQEVSREPEKLSFQVWVNRKRAFVRSPAAPLTPLKPDFADGFANQLHGDQVWRVYSIADAAGKVHVQVGAMRGLMEGELMRRMVLVLVGATVLLALLGTAIWWVVCWSLRPVMEIEAALREKKVFDLTPLPSDNLPYEIKPLVVAFNTLLGQLNQAMEGERQFIADAAHELRTPLAALQAHVQVALRAETVQEKDVALTKLLAVVERSARLSEQLLDLARLETGNRICHNKPLDLCALIPVVIRDFETTAAQRGQVISVETEPCEIAGDVDELGILVRNLVDNALRYSHDRGRVAVTCGLLERDGKRHGFLKVADNGPGVPEGARQHIFDRFYRVPGNGGRGSGIGLSLVARIVEFHDALIEVGEGLDGRGFGVTIVFPAAQDVRDNG